MGEDRYQPLPGLLELPGFLIGKLSPRGKRIAAVVGAIVLIGAAVGVALGIPAIVASKRATSRQEAREAARFRAARLAQLRREVQPVTGRGTAAHGLSGDAALNAREALRGDLIAAIRGDSAHRVRTGEFAATPRSVQCEGFPYQLNAPDPATKLGAAHGSYSCLAVTASIKRASYTSAGVIGYPYRALVDFPSGRFTFCRVSGRPGEMLIGHDVSVSVPESCGGR